MARGEAFVTCPKCGAQSRIPLMALQRNNYHCSHCGSPVPLSTVNAYGDSSSPAPRSRPKKSFQKHKRR